MPLTEELKYFAAHTNGDPVKTADAQNGAEVLEILEKATESLLTGVSSIIPNPLIPNPASVPNPKLFPNPNIFSHSTAVIDDNVEIGEKRKSGTSPTFFPDPKLAKTAT